MTRRKAEIKSAALNQKVEEEARPQPPPQTAAKSEEHACQIFAQKYPNKIIIKGAKKISKKEGARIEKFPAKQRVVP